MKSEKGITLTSLIIYIIAMLVVITVITVITTYFYNNVNKIGEHIEPAKEYTKFNSFFTEEINKIALKVIETKKDENSKQNHIIFSDGTQYTFIYDENSKYGNVYKNKSKICENINNMYFEYKIDETSGKEIIIVYYKLEEDTVEKITKFTLVN